MDFTLLSKLWKESGYVDDSAYSLAKFRATLLENGISLNDIYTLSPFEMPYVVMKDKSMSSESVTLHSHSFYEFIYCTRTKGVIYLIGSEQYVLQSGDVVCVKPEISHRPIFPQNMDGSFDRIIIHVSSDFAKEISEKYLEKGEDLVSHFLIRTKGSPDEARIRDIFESSHDESFNKPIGWKLRLVCNILQLLCFTSDSVNHKNLVVPPLEKVELTDKIIDYIETHYTEKLTLESVGKKFYVSPSTVSHLFSDKLQTSFYRFVTERRLAESQNLILKGYALEEVGITVGFSNYQNFFRSFKKYFGLSPSEYKKMLEKIK